MKKMNLAIFAMLVAAPSAAADGEAVDLISGVVPAWGPMESVAFDAIHTFGPDQSCFGYYCSLASGGVIEDLTLYYSSRMAGKTAYYEMESWSSVGDQMIAFDYFCEIMPECILEDGTMTYYTFSWGVTAGGETNPGKVGFEIIA